MVAIRDSVNPKVDTGGEVRSSTEVNRGSCILLQPLGFTFRVRTLRFCDSMRAVRQGQEGEGTKVSAFRSYGRTYLECDKPHRWVARYPR